MPQQINIPKAMAVANTLHQQQKFGESQKVLLQVLQVAPQYAPALHLLGVSAYGQGHRDQGINMLRQAVNVAPNEADYLANLCEMCRQVGRLDEAVHFGERAIAANPNLVSGLSNLGICYYDQENYDKAKALQQQALKLKPQFIPALNNLGSIAKQEKELDKAEELYKRVLAIAPNHIESMSNLGAIVLEDERPEEALEILTDAVKRFPKHAEAHCNRASTLVVLNRRKDAVPAFERAIKLRPHYFEATTGLARVMLAENQRERALQLASVALQLKPQDTIAHTLMGDVQAALGNSDQAAREFEIALQIDPKNITTIVSQGQLYLELGELSQAEDNFLHALEIEPDSTPAKTSLIQARKVTEDDSVFASLLEKRDELDDMMELRAMTIHFALGKGFDDLKQYADAFPHYAAGCAIKRRQIEYSTANYEAHINNIKRFFSKERIDAARSPACQSDVPIFVLGTPRSGTTLTEQIIASHPDVFGAGELHDLLRISHQPNDWESAGFPSVFMGFNAAQYKAVGEKYVAGLRRRAPDAKRITDKMPANFTLIGLIHLILPNAKIVHINRSPVDSCLSMFTRHFAHNSQPHSYDLAELGHYYSQYHSLMAHWREVLPEGSFYDLQYEELVDDNETQARALIDFCGLEWDDRCLEFHKTKRGIKTASVTQVRQPIYKTSVERWRAYEEHLTPLFDALGPLAPERGVSAQAAASEAPAGAEPKAKAKAAAKTKAAPKAKAAVKAKAAPKAKAAAKTKAAPKKVAPKKAVPKKKDD